MLTDDVELDFSDIQQLSGPDALAAFFARLGYKTDGRIVQTKAALNLTADSLAPITHIERLAMQGTPGLDIAVYLVETNRINKAMLDDLVRAFRDRGGDFLFVLTDSKTYDRLDFVLTERFAPDSTTSGMTTQTKARIRPRVLTVARHNPDKIAQRVLRRFSYTESDALAQYDKLISAYDVADWSATYFNNRALFSDYYLTTRLPERPEWRDKNDPTMQATFRTLRKLYSGVRDEFGGQSEIVVRQKLFEPIFAALGFTTDALTPNPSPVATGAGNHSDTIQPDYLLKNLTPNPFPAPPSGVRSVKEGEQDAGKPLAIALTYAWGRNLDGKDEGRDGARPDENPGAAVVTLLERGDADWAIVTNGKLWRLYAAKAHSRATNYYEIDLEETLNVPPADRPLAFRYFWFFFRAAAFATPAQIDPDTRALSFLDSLMSESERYARELGERLKERVFEEIFPHFARGFIIYARQHGLLPAGLDDMAADERARLLEPYFGGTLTFLYRMLFLLYAESRDLLPVREMRGYHPHSLERIRHEIAQQGGDIEDIAPGKLRGHYSETATDLYERLQTLFAAVDTGNTDLNVPVYNGGLFQTAPDPADSSPEATIARFLATHKIPDRFLALGLDRMARDVDDKTHSLVAIDYKSLGVRQLGSIYEGLLEFKLRVAPEIMAVVKGKKTEEIVTLVEAHKAKLPILKSGRGKDAPERTLPKGAVYLENDRRERKATGSYYTPDYIVKYIVQNTIGPVLADKLEALRPQFRAAEQHLRAERAKYATLKQSGDTPENQTYLAFRDTLNEAFFDLKVLDPAMGSGHFLVEAVDFITDRMADFLNAFPYNPIVYGLTSTRQEIIREMAEQGITIDTAKLTNLNLLKRQVLKRCIYGVDLNPMAVELAKVSLWLDCFTLGAPCLSSTTT